MRFELEHAAGECRVERDGLYWSIDARCARQGADAPCLFCGGRSLGHFLPDGGVWRLQTRVSVRTLPITPQSVFSLTPVYFVPYSPDRPLPCIDCLPDLVPILQNGTLFLQCPHRPI